MAEDQKQITATEEEEALLKNYRDLHASTAEPFESIARRLENVDAHRMAALVRQEQDFVEAPASTADLEPEVVDPTQTADDSTPKTKR